MATITSTLQGRLLTVFNRTSRSVGAAGKVIPPGGSRQVRLAQVQGSPTKMDDLNAMIAAGHISVQLDGAALQESSAAVLDTPVGGEYQATREVWDNLAAANVAAIKVAFTAPAVDTTNSGGGANLDGPVGPGEMVPPRNIVITGTTGVGEALDGGTAVVIGEDIDGVLRSENLTLGAIGASSSDTATGVIAFRRIISVLIPGDASSPAGDYEIGFGTLVGLSRPLTQGVLLNEFTDNAVPGTGATVVLAGTSAPNGTVEFNTAPNGAHDYIVAYVPN